MSVNENIFIITLMSLPLITIIEFIITLNLKFNNSIKKACADGDGYVLTSNANDIVLKILYFLKIFNILAIFYLLIKYINLSENINHVIYYITIISLILASIFNIIIYNITPTFIESEDMCNFKKGHKRYSINTIFKNVVSIITIIFTYYCIFELLKTAPYFKH